MIFLAWLIIINYGIVFTYATKQCIEFSLFFIISSLIVLLYLAAYVSLLKITALLILFLGGALSIPVVYILIKQRKQLFSHYFTPTFSIGLIFTFLLCLSAYHLQLTLWDEFTHWFPHTYLTYLRNGFPLPTDNTINKAYPLGGALFHYLFFQASDFSVGHAFFAQTILITTPLFVILKNKKWDDFNLVILLFIALFIGLKLLKVDVGPGRELTMDTPVAIFMGCALAYYFNSPKNWRTILYLIPILGAIQLFKPALFPLNLLATGLILIDTSFSTLSVHEKTKNFIALIPVFFIPLLVQKSWRHYLISTHTPIQWSLKLNLHQLYHSLIQSPSKNTLLIMDHFVSRFFSQEMIFISFALLTSFTFFWIKKDEIKRCFILLSVLFVLGYMTYGLGLLIMYAFNFTFFEASRLYSFDRYNMIYLTLWFLVIASFFIAHFKLDKIPHILKTITALASLVVIIPGVAYFHEKKIEKYKEKNGIWRLQHTIQRITKVANQKINPNASVYTIWENAEGLERAIIVSQMTPRKPNRDSNSYGKPFGANDIWTKNISPAHLKNRLSHCDYVLLAYTNASFWQQYGALFPSLKLKKPLAIYTLCLGKGFNPVNQVHCETKNEKAYLFKVIKKNGAIYFK